MNQTLHLDNHCTIIIAELLHNYNYIICNNLIEKCNLLVGQAKLCHLSYFSVCLDNRTQELCG